MRPELITMRLLIESANNLPALVWAMMGVKSLIYDNARCFLLWSMGEGANYARVKFTYDEGKDLYDLEFMGHVADSYDTYADTLDYNRREAVNKQKNRVLTGLYDDNIIDTIEEQTGFLLSLNPR